MMFQSASDFRCASFFFLLFCFAIRGGRTFFGFCRKRTSVIHLRNSFFFFVSMAYSNRYTDCNEYFSRDFFFLISIHTKTSLDKFLFIASFNFFFAFEERETEFAFIWGLWPEFFFRHFLHQMLIKISHWQYKKGAREKDDPIHWMYKIFQRNRNESGSRFC